ncbi:aminoglycoside phosphotransferase family protein [Microbacterium sp. NC79]|uniref:aminoglycoside phosphotransferase family protein n=1 Tax=Microbacterium sp. NC79 TaxID=2851009 RepID=UPI001C2B942D|nr:aminoglycoside phosphotransferase family protein [Microbacterium sp. NC79]MBV0894000.1 aminoglycoside phosphotransferase family protein [Microbacterium sp. NC79]
MRREQPFTIPPAVRNRFETRDETTRSWVGGLPTLARDIFAEWDLRADGHTHSGEAGIVVPVRRADGAAAALKFQPPSTETAAAILALTRWDGQGAVRLLYSSSERGVLLLERLTADRSLHSVPDDEAIHVVGGLLARLHAVAAPDELPRLDTVVAEMMSHVEPARRVLSPDDRVRLDRWVSRVNEVRNDSSHTSCGAGSTS